MFCFIVNEISIWYFDIHNHKELQYLLGFNLNTLSEKDYQLISIDFLYEINYYDFKDQQLKNIDLILIIGTDVGMIISVEIKFKISDFFEFTFESVNILRKKKYFHRIEDVNKI